MACGMPRSMAPRCRMLAMVSMSMYSSIRGSTECEQLRERTRDLLEHLERREARAAVRQARHELEHDLGDDRERAFRADHELCQVVAAGHFHELATGADHLAGREHRGQAEYLVARHAVLDRLHATGVGADVAADRRAVFARDD